MNPFVADQPAFLARLGNLQMVCATLYIRRFSHGWASTSTADHRISRLPKDPELRYLTLAM